MIHTKKAGAAGNFGNLQGTTMKLLLDNLFYLGQIASLAGLAWGAWQVARERLIESVCPAGSKSAGAGMSLAGCLLLPFLRPTLRV